MHTYASGESGPLPLKSPLTIVTSLGLFFAALLIAVPVYAGWLSGSSNDLYRYGMPLLWIGLALAAIRAARFEPFRVVLLSLFGVSLGFALAHIVDTARQDWLGLLATTPQGATVVKIGSEIIPVCASILFAAYLARLSLRSLSLIGGRVWLYMGYAYVAITKRTGSLWGAVLSHALADILFMSIYFARV